MSHLIHGVHEQSYIAHVMRLIPYNLTVYRLKLQKQNQILLFCDFPKRLLIFNTERLL